MMQVLNNTTQILDNEMSIRSALLYGLSFLFILTALGILGSVIILPVIGILVATVVLGALVAFRRRVSGIKAPNWIGR